MIFNTKLFVHAHLVFVLIQHIFVPVSSQSWDDYDDDLFAAAGGAMRWYTGRAKPSSPPPKSWDDYEDDLFAAAAAGGAKRWHSRRRMKSPPPPQSWDDYDGGGRVFLHFSNEMPPFLHPLRAPFMGKRSHHFGEMTGRGIGKATPSSPRRSLQPTHNGRSVMF